MGLGPREHALVALSAALAGRVVGSVDPDGLDEALRTAGAAADGREVEEVLVQSYLFLGYPAALTALGRWRRLSGRSADGPEPADWRGWEERGEDVCRRVYGAQYEGLRANVRALHPDLETWMVVEGYGKVLGRPGLELRVRELCILTILAVLDAPAQLYSHLRGALRAGARSGEVGAALELAGRVGSTAARAAAAATWSDVQARAAGTPGRADAG